MAGLTTEFVLEAIQSRFENEIIHTDTPYGMLTLEVLPASVPAILQFLYEDDRLRFRFLTDLCGIHYPHQTAKELGVIYHVHSLENNFRIRLKAFIPEANPEIPSVTSIFRSANWQERETFDFFGIQFKGHPDLRRILNMDEMSYHPLLKQYPLEDPTRTDKDDKYFGR